MRRGFSLIEVIITIGVIGVLLIIFQAVLTGSTASVYAKNEGIALSIAESELESLRSGGYSALPASGSFSASDLSTLPGGAGALAISDYSSSLKEVVVTVSWDKHGTTGQHTLSLDTLIAKIGGLP